MQTFRTRWLVGPLRTLLAVGALSAGLAAQAAAPVWSAELEARIAPHIAGDRRDFCLQVAVVRASGVQRAQACAQPRPGRMPPANAVFEIGSISKTMLAFLVADLVADGRWHLDDPIARHLPAGTTVPRQRERQISVRDLLTHSASLPRLPPGWRPTDAQDPYAHLTDASVLAALGEVDLIAPGVPAIGSRSAYSNFGFMLLGLAVAQTHGADLPAVLQRQLFGPLGMASAHMAVTHAPPMAGVAVAPGHHSFGAPTKSWTTAPNLGGVGMVRASLDDMVWYAQAHLGLLTNPGASAPPLAELQRRLQMTHQPLAHGHGWAWFLPPNAGRAPDSQGSGGGRALVTHAGVTGGYNAVLALDPVERSAVVLLADTLMVEVPTKLALSLLGLPVAVPPARLAVAMPAELRAAAVGRYRLGRLGVTVWPEGDSLMLRADGQRAFKVQLDSLGDFYLDALDAWAQPIREGDAITGFTWFQGGGASRALREAPPEPKSP